MSNLPDVVFVRVVRTMSSERYLVQDHAKPEVDIAAVDIHYLNNAVVAATVVLLAQEYFGKDFINSLIETIDSRLLPMACLNDGDLSFTVVEGRVVGQFANTQQSAKT